MTNHDRACYGLTAIRTGNPDHESNDLETSLGDTLANIMHAADLARIDFDDALERGRMHHYAETHGEEDL